MTVTLSMTAESAVDFGKGRSWPEGAAAHFNKFRQGHIIDNIPTAYVGSAKNPHWQLPTQTLHDSCGPGLNIVAEEGTPLRYAMVLTQGCDINKLHAWVTVSPVYDASASFNSSELGNIRSGRTYYILPLDPPWASDGAKMVADLRFVISIEKTVLLDREPLEAYRQPSDYANVANRLSFLAQRPDIASAVLDSVVIPFFTWLREHEMAGLQQVRIWQDDASAPSATKLYLIFSDDEKPDTEVLDDIFARLYESAAQEEITLQGPLVASTLDSMTARDYAESLEVKDEESS